MRGRSAGVAWSTAPSATGEPATPPRVGSPRRQVGPDDHTAVFPQPQRGAARRAVRRAVGDSALPAAASQRRAVGRGSGALGPALTTQGSAGCAQTSARCPPLKTPVLLFKLLPQHRLRQRGRLRQICRGPAVHSPHDSRPADAAHSPLFGTLPESGGMPRYSLSRTTSGCSERGRSPTSSVSASSFSSRHVACERLE